MDSFRFLWTNSFFCATLTEKGGGIDKKRGKLAKKISHFLVYLKSDMGKKRENCLKSGLFFKWSKILTCLDKKDTDKHILLDPYRMFT